MKRSSTESFLSREAAERTLLIAEALFGCRNKRNLFIKSGAGGAGEGREFAIARHEKSNVEPAITVKKTTEREAFTTIEAAGKNLEVNEHEIAYISNLPVAIGDQRGAGGAGGARAPQPRDRD